MIIELLNTLETWPALEPAWQRLAESRGNLFVGPDWVATALSVFAPSNYLLAVAREGREVVGVMPIEGRPGRRNVMRFLGSELGDRFEPLCAGAVEQEFLGELASTLEGRGGFRMMVLNHVDVESTWWRRLAGGEGSRIAAVAQRESEEFYIDLAGLDWDGYLATRSKSFRKRLSYIERALGRDHSVLIRESQDSSRLDQDLDRFFALHELRWQARGGSSLADASKREFIRQVATRLLQRGQLRLRFLEVDGTAVASLLAWKFGGRYCYYQGGFDPAWSKSSVGTLLIGDTIRAAIKEGADEFDFLLGEEPYKRRFATNSRRVANVVLVGRRRPAHLIARAEAWLRRRFADTDSALLRRLGSLAPSRRQG